MVEVFSIGFTQTSAERFFARLTSAGVRRVLDVRLNNRSQLSGFAKRDDLEFFLRSVGGIGYEHELLLAPDNAMLDDFKKFRRVPWEEYEQRFLALLADRQVERHLSCEAFAEWPTALLCSEAGPERCHRRLAIEYLARHWGDVQAVHL